MKKSSLLPLLVCLSAARAAHAQDTSGYAVNHLVPSQPGSGFFTVDSAQPEGRGRLALGLVSDYSARTLVDYAASGSINASLVRNQYFLHPGAAFFFADRVRVAATIPLLLAGDGRTATIRGVTYAPPNGDVTVGDVRFGADVRVLGENKDALALAVGAELHVPAGSPREFTGDGEPRVAPRLLLGGESGDLVYGARLGLHLRGRKGDFGDGKIGSELQGALAVGLRMAERKLVIGPELLASTVMSDAFGGKTTPAEVLLGGKYTAGNVRLGAAMGFGLTESYGAPVIRNLVTLEWIPQNPEDEKADAKPKDDRDQDGIPDCEDACGYEKGPKSTNSAENGCPPRDADKDGIPDAEDMCPLVSGAPSNDERRHGCAPDTDKDGIDDKEDACPSEAGKKSSDASKNGCPERDKDGDGILDAEDACPDKPGPKSQDTKVHGCPDPDRDKDGIPNDSDACPDDAGKSDTDPKKSGCPKAYLQGGVIQIIEQVRFLTGSATIQPGKDSQEILEAVHAVLKGHPDIKHVRVEGHTDNKGAPGPNKVLSQARANAVVQWLVKKGLSKDMFTAKGFGSEKPLASNDSEVGRLQNRRVEFHVEGGAK